MPAVTEPVVAVVGRPNVGKSTLVNRLIGRREAIVEERPGVTRDRTTHSAEWRGRTITVVDTGGWMPQWADPSALDADVSAQAERATETADAVVLVVDVTVGITEEDAAVVEWLRERNLDVILVANKADALGTRTEVDIAVAELYALGLGEPHPVSAMHGRGSGDLLDIVWDHLTASGAFEREAPATDPSVPAVALIGRPNVGKSSLLNRVAGEERAVVHDAPGTTRDAVDSLITTDEGRTYRVVDTAGLRRPARVRRTSAKQPTEYYATLRTQRALEQCDVALFILDASVPVSEQDQRLADMVTESGRAVVLVWNKWDLVDDDARADREKETERLLGFIAFAPVVRISALTGRSIHRLWPAVDTVMEQWRRRIPTAELNRWLADAVAATAPPMHAGRSVRLRYVTQAGIEPPTFRIFGSGRVPDTYTRYLERRLREAYGFSGTPVDVQVRVRTRWEDRDSS